MSCHSRKFNQNSGSFRSILTFDIFFSDPLEGDHFEGDISGVKLTIQEAEDESPLEEYTDNDEGESVIIKNAVKNTYRLWPDNEIPYVISNSFGSQERSVIRTAMEQFTRQGLSNVKVNKFFLGLLFQHAIHYHAL